MRQLVNITAVQRVSFVMKGGTIVKQGTPPERPKKLALKAAHLFDSISGSLIDGAMKYSPPVVVTHDCVTKCTVPIVNGRLGLFWLMIGSSPAPVAGFAKPPGVGVL